VTPLAIGQKEGEVAVASETCVFPNLGLSVKKYVIPGEIVFISTKGIEEKKKGIASQQDLCIFMGVY
jgi:amidophosphoribosyltransferase